jgi:Fe-S-cluster containining protein
MSDQPWYHAGLAFACVQCGGCCTGEPGYVWVNRDEIATLAAALGLDPEQFQARYVRRVGKRRCLLELANGDCVFFDRHQNGCQVYAVRPRQCRAWPFWTSNLESPVAWSEMCRRCPGGNRGPRVPLSEIQARLCRL